MTRFGARVALASLALVLALGGAPAYAKYPDTPRGAQRDCGAGHYPLQGHYTIAVLEKALAGLSTSAVEYTTCKDALEAAIRAQETKPKHHKTNPPPTKTTTTQTTTSTTHTSTTHTRRRHHHHRGHTVKPKHGSTGGTGPISSQQISAAVTNGKRPQRVDGVVYTPGAVTTHSSSFISSIPDPVLALLAAVIAVLGALAGLAVRNIVRARRTG